MEYRVFGDSELKASAIGFGTWELGGRYGDIVDKLHAICVVCGAPATRTQRLLDGQPASYDDSIIRVGASEVYEARCRRCHEVPGRPREPQEKS